MHAPVFGYAKPVPYNPNNFKDKRVGDVVVGLAGPAANLVLALIGSALMFALHAQAHYASGILLLLLLLVPADLHHGTLI